MSHDVLVDIDGIMASTGHGGPWIVGKTRCEACGFETWRLYCLDCDEAMEQAPSTWTRKCVECDQPDIRWIAEERGSSD